MKELKGPSTLFLHRPVVPMSTANAGKDSVMTANELEVIP